MRGTHASGGIGRRISNTGKKNSRKYRLTASASPSGIPMSCANRKPASTRLKLRYQLSQYPGCGSTETHATATSVGGGNQADERQRESEPLVPARPDLPEDQRDGDGQDAAPQLAVFLQPLEGGCAA